MIAAIAFAAAPVSALAVYLLMRQQVRLACARVDQAEQAEAIRTAERDKAVEKAAAWGGELFDMRGRAFEAEGALATYKATEAARTSAHMREIGIRGNQSPKRKRA